MKSSCNLLQPEKAHTQQRRHITDKNKSFFKKTPNRCRNGSDKIQHPFIIKTLQKVGIEGIYLNIIKDIYDKTTNNVLNSEKLKAFPLRSGTRQGCLLSPLGKEIVKQPLFTGDMILYIENPKDATTKLPELINEFSKVGEYKINTPKSVAFLYINKKKNQKEKLKQQSHLPLHQKK